MLVNDNKRSNICLIHGWGFDSWVLAGLAAELQGGRNTHLINLPGYGDNQPVNLPTDIDTIVDTLIADIPADSILVGWSLGGMIAIKIAYRMRRKIRAIILLASTPCFVKKRDWPYGIESSLIHNMAERIIIDVDDVLKEFAGLVARGDASPKQILRELELLPGSIRADKDTLLSGLKILMQTDLRKELSELECQMMMISGGRDQLIAAATGNASRELQPSLHIYNIRTAGHALIFSAKKEIAEVIDGFLCGLES